MAKTVNDITKSLKLRAESRADALTVRVGTKKHTLPFDVRMLTSDNYLFVHVPPSAQILKITDNGLQPVEDDGEAREAAASFRRSNRRSGRRSSKVDLTPELREALRAIPPGFKLAYGADGTPRLVKTRKRQVGKNG